MSLCLTDTSKHTHVTLVPSTIASKQISLISPLVHIDLSSFHSSGLILPLATIVCVTSTGLLVLKMAQIY